MTAKTRLGIGDHTISNCARGGAMVVHITQGKGGRHVSQTRHTSDAKKTASIHAVTKTKRRRGAAEGDQA